MPYQKWLLSLLLSLFSELAWAQVQPLPVFSVDRRRDLVYMDSISGLAKAQYRAIAVLPHTAQRDTIRFQTLYYLGRVYGWWAGRSDSIKYFGDELIRQAHERRNVEFEVKGLLLKE